MLKKIECTTDYSIFRKCQYNREVDECHVRNMMKSMQKQNLLHLHPLLVNDDMEIISGQHRFEAAKRLKFPIYYIQDNEIPEDFVLTSNAIQKKASMADCVEYWANRHKKPDYIYLNNLRKRLNICIKPLIFLIFGQGDRSMYLDMKYGDLEITDKAKAFAEHIIDKYLNFRDFCVEHKLKPLSMYNHMMFCAAFRQFVLLEPNMNTFQDKVLRYWQEMRKQPTVGDYRRMFVKIYNKGIRSHFLQDSWEKETEEG